MTTQIKSAAEITAMREGGKMLATVLAGLRAFIEPGITSKALADHAAKELRALGGSPAFLGYQGFPDVLCVSINDEVVHGIPDRTRIIRTGDVVGLDFGVLHKGMITDAAISVIVGKPKNDKVALLLRTTEVALYAAISVVKDGVTTGDIGNAAQTVLDKKELGIVQELVGHGVGHRLHEGPNIPNYGKKGIGPALKAGMTIAIEPMATLGNHRVYIANDGWTVKTRDGSLSAHFEHTVLITDRGHEILTAL